MAKSNLPATFLRFRESHHAVAKMFAAGMTISMVAQRTGYTRRRLHLLLNDPSFQELIVEFSKTRFEKVDEAADTYAELAVSNMLRAEAQIQEKLDAAEEADEFLPMRELLAIAKDRADRFGYGPKSTRISINADFATQLDRAIERTTKVIEARPNTHPSVVTTKPQGAEPHSLEQTATLLGTGPAESPDAPARSRASSLTGPSYTRILRRKL